MAEKRPKTITVHGDSRVDDYFWLRDKSDPQVMAYLKAEDAYADAVMKPTAAFQNALYNEMVGHIKETDDTVPYRRGDYFYYSRTIAGQQYPVYCRKHRSLLAPEEILLDLNEMAKGQAFMALGVVPAERRWNAPRVFNRQHGLSAVHAASEEPEDRRAVARPHRARGQRRVGLGQQDRSSM